MMNSDKVTAVTIYNRTYQLRSGGDPDYVQHLARHVDQRMVELAESTPTVDTLKLAILAALNIADDFLTLKEEQDGLERSIAESADRLNALLEPILDSETS
jgi:cell division protein ZapA